MSGKMPVNAKNSSRKELPPSRANPKQSNGSGAMSSMNSAMTEEERMAAMFQAQGEQWSAQQDEMAQ
jgi:protein MPE1